ncbi:transposase family protein, partial [Actinomycetospora sp. NBRC 106375]|uniref:transposase family protein n=1 Tax=Actinomycetospora sp. NBRC 106375 TaxID=3032207 RepID=UPI003324166B
MMTVPTPVSFKIPGTRCRSLRPCLPRSWPTRSSAPWSSGCGSSTPAVAGETTVLWCELLIDGPGRCPGCGIAGTYRDSTERRVSDVPVVGHPLELRVRVPRYRC